VLVAMAVLGGGTPATAASAKGRPSPAPTSRALSDAGIDSSLDPAQLRSQIAEAGRLRDELAASDAKIAASTTRLERLSVQANQLLQQYAKARTAEREATAEADRNLKLFEEMNAQASDDRRAVGAWAFHVYSGGGSIADLTAMFEVLSTPPSEASDPVAHLAYLSDQKVHALERIQSLAAEQQDVARKAVEARSAATVAALAAADARKKLDAVIARQKRELASTRALHAEQVRRVGPISGLLLGSGNSQALQATRDLRRAARLPDLVADSSVKACGGDERSYPNGHLPARALCPLHGAPGHSLRPGAAAAFNALSRAYEKDAGAPLCVTDSYRSLAEQVSVKASRGKWAAAPGTSEHGLGMALDLCGGVESFGSATHLWMRQNAPLYGWYHPAWAGPGGSLPEPWHWEYAG
jgi:zinc D-Ala-D-Ala carboxypeptidase